ncbi:glycosyltransferase [Psychromonas hadalis]|uniref:glycosyltransferase n=1 Tax=Psychromonas hadalis TaxID=211669 RepID=UPI0003B72598|nr:glycosyltransferase [Psychromonas hadalis]
MKTILQVVQHLRPGGIESIALDLTHFAPLNEHTLIVSLEGNYQQALATWPKLAEFKEQLIFLGKKPGWQGKLIYQLMRLIKQKNVYAVHTHHIGPLLYAGIAARLAGVKHRIHTEHDAWHLSNLKRRLLQRIVIKCVQPILVADAKTVANHMQQHLHCKQSINIINNGIDTDYFTPGNRVMARATLNLPQNNLMIGCSGRMETVKGQHVLIHALSRLPLSVHVVFAGSGSCEPELRRLVSCLCLQERVHFLGHLDQMAVFYQSLNIFCLPSLNEGFPLSSLEAQSCDVATLVTDVGASKETLSPSSGRLVKAEDCDAMASVLLDMINNPTETSPRLYVQQHANVQSMVSAYVSLRRPLTTNGVCHE